MPTTGRQCTLGRDEDQNLSAASVLAICIVAHAHAQATLCHQQAAHSALHGPPEDAALVAARSHMPPHAAALPQGILRRNVVSRAQLHAPTFARCIPHYSPIPLGQKRKTGPYCCVLPVTITARLAVVQRSGLVSPPPPLLLLLLLLPQPLPPLPPSAPPGPVAYRPSGPPCRCPAAPAACTAPASRPQPPPTRHTCGARVAAPPPGVRARVFMGGCEVAAGRACG